jgi:hypothetical protein
LLAYTKFTFKEFRVCVRAIFAFAGGYKLGERYLLGELERRLLPLRLALPSAAGVTLSLALCSQRRSFW